MPEPRIITASGELDIAASRELAPRLQEAVGDASRPLVIDLSEVTLMDSTFLGAVIQTHLRLSRQGRAMSVVVPPGSQVAAMLSVSGMQARLPTQPTRAQALAAVDEPEASEGDAAA